MTGLGVFYPDDYKRTVRPFIPTGCHQALKQTWKARPPVSASAESSQIFGLKHPCKTFHRPGSGFPEGQNGKKKGFHAIGGIKARKRNPQAGMTAQTASQQYPEPFLLNLQRPFPAGGDAKTAAHAAIPVHPNAVFLQKKGPVRADRHAETAPGAVLLADPRKPQGENPHIPDLGLGAGIGTACNGHAKFVVKAQVALHPFFQKREKILGEKAGFQPPN
jgi:hypothetical protein